MMTHLESLESRRLFSIGPGGWYGGAMPTPSATHSYTDFSNWEMSAYHQPHYTSGAMTYNHSTPTTSLSLSVIHLQLPPTVNPDTTVLLIIAPVDAGARAEIMQLPASDFEAFTGFNASAISTPAVHERSVIPIYVDAGVMAPNAGEHPLESSTSATTSTDQSQPVGSVFRPHALIRHSPAPLIAPAENPASSIGASAVLAMSNVAPIFASKNIIARAKSADDIISAATQALATKVESEAAGSLAKGTEIVTSTLLPASLISSIHLEAGVTSNLSAATSTAVSGGEASLFLDKSMDLTNAAIPASATPEVVMTQLAGGAVRQAFHFAHMGLPANWLNDVMANLANDMAGISTNLGTTPAASTSGWITRRSAWAITAGALAIDAAVIAHYTRKNRNNNKIQRRATRLTAARN